MLRALSRCHLAGDRQLGAEDVPCAVHAPKAVRSAASTGALISVARGSAASALPMAAGKRNNMSKMEQIIFQYGLRVYKGCYQLFSSGPS